jgi:uncharacterized protein YdcH (DUF465 family)
MSDRAGDDLPDVWERRDEIRQLSARNESFHDLCEDFAIAEAALHRWEKSSGPDRDQRCAEYRELVSELRNEVETALDRAVIVPFAKPRKP